MSIVKWRDRLSIFGRTFLLMIAALAVAEIVGIVLLLNRPPLHNAPVSLNELAQRLTDSAEPFAGPPPFAPGGPPPDAGPGRPPRFEHGPDRAGLPPDLELRTLASSTPPLLPKDADPAASAIVRDRLAALLGSDPASLIAHIPEDGLFKNDTLRIGDTTLREGFVVARHLGDGTWRVVESDVRSSGYTLQMQALLLFVAGMLILMPLAWFFARALATPVVNFSRAARRVGSDPNAAPLQVEGPREMLAAIESFNAMQARLNSLLRERTEMIAAIAHDLRTPLTRLAFRLDDLPAPLNEKVSADIQEMKSMISAALDFIRERTLSTRRERLDFRLLVESVVDDQSDLGHDVSLGHGEAITVLGDPLALRRVVMNVVDNSIKYGKRAQLQLAVTQDHCVLDIDDDGPGIADTQQQRVFEPFFRLESSRNRDTGGVGLGLAVVRAIVLDHGGDIQLRNRAGGGLRVTITLPLEPDAPSFSKGPVSPA